MQRNVIIVVLVCVIFECNGHLPSLTGILSGAHKHVHDTVQGVANTVLGGFHIDGHVQPGGHSHPEPPPPNKQPDTVIVIVDERPSNNYGPRPHDRPHQGYGQNNGYNNRPPYGHGGQNHYGHGRPWHNQNGNYNHENSNGPYGHHQNNFEHHPNNYGNENGYGQNQHGNQNHYNRPEQTTQGYGNSNNGYNNRPTGQSPEQNHENNGHTNQNNYGQTKPPSTAETRPTFGSMYGNVGHTQKPYQNDKTTPKSDEPLFVPLNPNEYVYGGDKINVTSPKRDTDDNKQASDNDEDLPINIRFQDN